VGEGGSAAVKGALQIRRENPKRQIGVMRYTQSHLYIPDEHEFVLIRSNDSKQ
jgi:hypothetical protein